MFSIAALGRLIVVMFLFRKRNVLGLVLAPLAASIILALALGIPFENDANIKNIRLVVFVSYAVLLYWAPILIWLDRKGLISFGSVVTGAIISGCLMWLPLLALFKYLGSFSAPISRIPSINEILVVILSWLITGGIFYAIANKEHNKRLQSDAAPPRA